MIPVVKPFLPPPEEYDLLLKGIWSRGVLTNRGPLAVDIEQRLKKYLSVNNLLFVSNGTIALQLAIKALGLKGEIITTPFSYVATTSSIAWEGCEPVYVDIDKHSLNIDATKIEAAVTEKTTAIVATHVYGNPCDVEAIQKIADKYELKVIYDAAHAFGVEINGISIFNYGDISTCSTHATKLFHTIEGGFVVTNNIDLHQKLTFMSNFGHNSPETFDGLGINGKNSEFHAAMGLANLPYMNVILNKRKQITNRYDLKLKKFKAFKPLWHERSSTNFSYYPIIFDTEVLLLQCIKVLNMNGIFGRRYFYPSLATSLPYVKTTALENTDSISKRVYCLPIFYDLNIDEVDFICSLLLEIQNNES
jgi:dTDP-4-amino-4,6-dideoxygalactose transaminase